MDILSFDNTYKQRLSVALGFFDSVHLGHRAIIKGAKTLAAETGSKSAVFTFGNNPFGALGRDTKLAYTFEERKALLEKAGADCVLAAGFTEEFAHLSDTEFLERLVKCCEIAALVCGPDYTYGRGGLGNAGTLKAFCSKNNIRFKIIPFVEVNGKRVSTTAVRKYLTGGDMAAAAKFLGAPYFLRGAVGHGRSVGKTLDFPTANLGWPKDKLQIKEGVYATRTLAGGKAYASVTNVGGKPTFGLNDYAAETFLLDYGGSLYGQEITVEFLQWMRPVRAFAGAEELKAQLVRDVKARREIK